MLLVSRFTMVDVVELVLHTVQHQPLRHGLHWWPVIPMLHMHRKKMISSHSHAIEVLSELLVHFHLSSLSHLMSCDRSFYILCTQKLVLSTLNMQIRKTLTRLWTSSPHSLYHQQGRPLRPDVLLEF